jgi:hypothetical protein
MTVAETSPIVTPVALADLRSSGPILPAFGGRTRDGAAGRGLDRGVAADMIGVPVGVPDLPDRPAAGGGLRQHRLGHGGIDHHRLGRWRDRGAARHNCR